MRCLASSSAKSSILTSCIPEKELEWERVWGTCTGWSDRRPPLPIPYKLECSPEEEWKESWGVCKFCIACASATTRTHLLMSVVQGVPYTLVCVYVRVRVSVCECVYVCVCVCARVRCMVDAAEGCYASTGIVRVTAIRLLSCHTCTYLPYVTYLLIRTSLHSSHTCTHAQTHVRTHAHTHTHTHVRTNTRTHQHTHKHIHTRTYARANKYAHIFLQG